MKKIVWIIGIFVLVAIAVGAYFCFNSPVLSENWVTKMCPNEKNFACRANLSCEGNNVTIKGYIDTRNIFESAPKFSLVSKKGGHNGDPDGQTIEIYLTEKNIDFFKALTQKAIQGEIIEVSGIIEGYDAPINGACSRFFYIRANPSDVKI